MIQLGITSRPSTSNVFTTYCEIDFYANATRYDSTPALGATQEILVSVTVSDWSSVGTGSVRLGSITGYVNNTIEVNGLNAGELNRIILTLNFRRRSAQSNGEGGFQWGDWQSYQTDFEEYRVYAKPSSVYYPYHFRTSGPLYDGGTYKWDISQGITSLFDNLKNFNTAATQIMQWKS